MGVGLPLTQLSLDLIPSPDAVECLARTAPGVGLRLARLLELAAGMRQHPACIFPGGTAAV